MVLLLDHVCTTHVLRWVSGPLWEAAPDVLLLTIFSWLALRGRRWWPFLMTASLVLIVMVHGLAALTPVGRYVALSARLGLWILIYLTLLVGVAERWLAGERPISEGLWRRKCVSAAP